MKLAELAKNFKLTVLFIVLANPLNVPRVAEMCPCILATGRYLNFKGKDSYKEYIKFLKERMS